MRIMNLLLVCSIAMAGSEMSRATWDEYVEDVKARDETTLDKVKALRSVASTTVIQESGKIRDIRPHKQAIEILTCGVRGGPPVRRFIVSKSDRELVETKWKKWDRLTWRVTPRIHSLDNIELVPVYRSVADLGRTPNPGLAKVDVPMNGLSYSRWCAAYRGYSKARRWGDLWRMVRKVRGKAFAFKGVVEKVRESHALIRVNGGEAWITIADPQVLESLREGAKVKVGGLLESKASGFRDFKKSNGGLSLRFVYAGSRK